MMQKYALASMVLAFSIALSSCSPSEIINRHRPQYVPAGALYDLSEGSYVEIRVPHSTGWQLVPSRQDELVFMKGSELKNQTFAAQAALFPLKQTQNRDEFVSLIKQEHEAGSDPERFEMKYEFQYSEQRRYPCVKVTSVGTDKLARTTGNRREPLLFQIEAIYCRHPRFHDAGFSAIYSHRGPSLHPNFRAEAQDFIDGVQVVEY